MASNLPKQPVRPLSVEDLISLACSGDDEALGQLLSTQRPTMRILARVEVGRHLQGRIDASDIVQETFLQAHKSIQQFKGSMEPQFAKWLRSILAHTIANTLRRHLGTQARDARLEQQLVCDIDQSALSFGGMLADPGNSPSEQSVRAEQSRLVIEALSRLPAEYESVLILRHLEELTFPQIADRLGKTVYAVEKLWIRGLAKLKTEFATTVSPSGVR